MEHGRKHCPRHSGSLSSVSCFFKDRRATPGDTSHHKSWCNPVKKICNKCNTCETKMMVLPDCFAVLTHRRHAGPV